LQQDISQEHGKLSIEQTLVSIKASMEHLEDEVSAMAETLEVLVQGSTEEQFQGTT